MSLFYVSLSTNHATTPCDPLVPEYCTLPFPNDYWLLKDNNNNPIHLSFNETNLPITKIGETMNPYYWNKLNGFSPLPAIMAFWSNISIQNCPRLWNISESQETNSPIIILDTITNET